MSRVLLRALARAKIWEAANAAYEVQSSALHELFILKSSRSFTWSSTLAAEQSLKSNMAALRNEAAESKSGDSRKQRRGGTPVSQEMRNFFDKFQMLQHQDQKEEALELFEKMMNEGFENSDSGELPEVYRPNQAMVDAYANLARRTRIGELERLRDLIRWVPRMGGGIKAQGSWFSTCFAHMNTNSASAAEMMDLLKQMRSLGYAPSAIDALNIAVAAVYDRNARELWELISPTLTRAMAADVERRVSMLVPLLVMQACHARDFNLAFSMLGTIVNLLQPRVREPMVIDIYATILHHAIQADESFHVDNSLRALIKPLGGVEVSSAWQCAEPEEDSQASPSDTGSTGPLRLRHPKLPEGVLLAALEHYARRARTQHVSGESENAESSSTTADMAKTVFNHLVRCLAMSSYHDPAYYRSLGHSLPRKAPLKPPEVPMHLVTPRPAAYHALLHVLAYGSYAGHWTDLLDWLSALVVAHGANNPRSVSVFHSLAGFVEAVHDVRQVRDIFVALVARCEESPTRPVHISMMNLMLRALARLGEVDRAAKLFEDISRLGLKPDVDSFNCVIEACVNSKKSHNIKGLVLFMKQQGVMPNNTTNELRLRVFLANRDFERLMAELTTMFAENVSPPPHILREAYLAAAEAGDEKARNRMMAELMQQGLPVPSLQTKPAKS